MRAEREARAPRRRRGAPCRCLRETGDVKLFASWDLRANRDGRIILTALAGCLGCKVVSCCKDRMDMDRAFLAELRRIVGDAGGLEDALELLTYECDARPHRRER